MKWFLIIFLLLSGCNYVAIDGERIFVEVADKPQQRNKGLMYRQSLCRDCGMLFVFNDEERHVFWMKNTLIPLDMIFINSDLEVVDVIHAVPCNESPCKSYLPNEKALYVLETNPGRFKDVIGKNVRFRIN